MLLKDYLLTLLMEEFSEATKNCSKIIRYGQNYSFTKNKDNLTTCDLLSYSIANCQAITILLYFLKMYITPSTVEHLINEKDTTTEMEYRIKNIFQFIRDNEYLEIDLKEVDNLEKVVGLEFKKAKLKMEV